MTDSFHSANAETCSVQALGASATGLWTVCPGDARFVSIPDVAKPINAGSIDRARLIAAAPELKEQLATMTALLRIKCGNLEPDIFAEILKSEAVLAKAIGATS